MTQSERLEQDLRYVRQAVTRKTMLDRTPTAIPWLWAIFVLIAFTLLDLAPRAAGWMFAVGAPLCGVLSLLIGMRQARREGEINRREGLLQALHWGSIFISMIVLPSIAWSGRIGPEVAGQIATLLVGLVYFLAGVHFDWRWMISGTILIVGAAAVAWIPVYPWSTLGAVVCVALILPTFIGTASHEH